MGLSGWECEIEVALGWVLREGPSEEAAFELRSGDTYTSPSGEDWRWGDVTEEGSKGQGPERSKFGRGTEVR